MIDTAQVLRFLYPGLEAEMAKGTALIRNDDIVRWPSSLGTAPTGAEIAAATVPAARHYRTAEIRAEAAALILSKWPAWAQSNCALGIYPEATAAQCSADIAAVVTASNAAEDAVTAATTVAEVEAVTATWPTL